jgi:chromosome segregation ATPase
LQAFALAKEFDLVSAQIPKIRADRDRYLAKSEAVQFQLAAVEQQLETARQELVASRKERDTAHVQLAAIEQQLVASGKELDTAHGELESMRQQTTSLTHQLESLGALISAREGLRYLTKATARAYSRRLVSDAIIRPARLLRPYLPPFALAAARKVARTLHLDSPR